MGKRAKSTLFLLAFLCLLLPREASALVASRGAFRIEDSKSGNLLLGAEHARIEQGEVYNKVVLLWGDLDISGQVKDVVVLSGHVTFEPGARLTDKLVVMGGSFTSKPGAVLSPDNVNYELPGPFWRFLRSAAGLWMANVSWLTRAAGALVSCLLLWGFGLGIFWAFPGLQAATADGLLRDGAKNFLAGLLGTLLAPVFLVLLVISLLGIALLPLYFLLAALAGLVSYLAAALWAGHRLLPRKAGKRLNAAGFFLGLLAFQFLWASGVWWAVLPVLFLWTLGWGALLRASRKLWR
jgi:hypothetical protein